MKAKTIEDYLDLPYTIEVIRDNNKDDPGWVARVKELPGCMTQGDTFEELGKMVADALRGWLEIALEDGIPIPEPRFDEEYSGKFVVRLPRSLHRELVETAEREGVSLNALINAALAKTVGEMSAKDVNTSKPVLPPNLTRAGIDENAGQAVPYPPASQPAHSMAEKKPDPASKPKQR
jgi:antitoxin HicB